MKPLATGLKGSQKLQAAQQRLRNFSKQAEVNTSYRLFFPLIINESGELDIAVTTGLGRTLDWDKLGKSFVEVTEYNISESGQLTDLTILSSISRMARIFHEAACEEEKMEAERKARETAEAMGTELNIATLQQAIKNIQVKYFGDEDADPRVLPKETPIVSGLKTPTYTEVLAVPLDPQGMPVFAKYFIASMELRGKRTTQLTTILNNKDYTPSTAQYLEIGYDYMGKDKQTAGQNAAFNGIASTLTLEVKYPEIWAANKDKLLALSKDAETMMAKNMTFSTACTPEEAAARFNKYVSTKPLTLLHLDYESDEVKRSAKDLLELDAVKGAKKIQERLIEIVEAQQDIEVIEKAKKEDNIEGNTISAKAEVVKDAETLRELEKAVEDLDSLVGADIDNI